MSYAKSGKNKFIFFLLTCFVVLTLIYIKTIFSLPSQITLFENREYTYDFKSPFLNIKPDTEDVLMLESRDVSLNSVNFKFSTPVMFKPQKMGRVNLNMELFSFIPLKTMQVDVIPDREVVPCGNTIGVKINMEGFLVVALSEFETIDGKSLAPAKEAGIKPGDLIVEINKKPVESISQLIKYLDNFDGKSIHVKYKRGNSYHNAIIEPAISLETKKYQLGMWLRDSTAGIGTLTFYDPETKKFGALGHGITDVDTGILMPLDDGEIVESSILAVKKGKQGEPGELKGILIEDKEKLGVISKNCDQGIYGILNENAKNEFPDKLYSIGLKNEIKLGAASIMSNIDGKSVEEFDIEIQKISERNASGSKGMMIKVTDKRLLEATGGIVQGMSGSPILQNGKLIGAVTHVLINDPTKGYGIFIENMIKNIDTLNTNVNTNMKKAS